MLVFNVNTENSIDIPIPLGRMVHLIHCKLHSLMKANTCIEIQQCLCSMVSVVMGLFDYYR